MVRTASNWICKLANHGCQYFPGACVKWNGALHGVALTFAHAPACKMMLQQLFAIKSCTRHIMACIGCDLALPSVFKGRGCLCDAKRPTWQCSASKPSVGCDRISWLVRMLHATADLYQHLGPAVHAFEFDSPPSRVLCNPLPQHAS